VPLITTINWINVDDFKPASVDTSQPGNLDVGQVGEVNVSLPNTQVVWNFNFTVSIND
jgi:hypothetical protein